MRNIKLILEYDGSDFHGWQFQPNLRTVQGVLEIALNTLLSQSIRTTVAGRTDSGVHAYAQVVNFLSDSKLPLERIRRGLNGLLPYDVRILDISEVGLNFNARFDAIARTYHYKIYTCPTALYRNYYWVVRYNVQIKLLRQASLDLLGEHDCKAFCSTQTQLKHYKVNVKSITWIEEDTKLYFKITANRFVHNMVRGVVGTLIDIGRGKFEVDRIKLLLETGDRSLIGVTAPAKGLYLANVDYP